MPKTGNRAANRLVIRFVMAKLKAATDRLRNRIRRMGASKSTRSERTHAVITMVAVDLIATSRTRLLLASGWGCRGRTCRSRYNLINESVETDHHYGSNAVPQEILLTIRD
jgi:hypothetical protein